MHSRFWRALLCGCVAFALTWLLACAENEHRKVRVTEEQHEGEVVEEQPGEMIVE
jgi:hypothetical protein